MHLFRNFCRNSSTIFKGKNLLWFAGAIVLTLAALYSGLDWWWFTHAQASSIRTISWSGVAIGGLLPIWGTIVFLLVAYLLHKKREVLYAWGVGQAALLGFLISTILKAFTGRVQPPRGLIEGMADASHSFQLGFLNHGVFWGWPSSHTTVAFAMAAALIAMYPRNKAVRICAFIYALYIGLCVSVGIHWFSEFIAGALIGWVIGRVVGQSFRGTTEK